MLGSSAVWVMTVWHTWFTWPQAFFHMLKVHSPFPPLVGLPCAAVLTAQMSQGALPPSTCMPYRVATNTAMHRPIQRQGTVCTGKAPDG